jgi:methylglutaconyl-CoA hydratase
MNNGIVKTSSADGILTIEFSHPKGNCMPGSSLRELSKHIDQAAKDITTRAIILRSTGDSVFCSGASFDELLQVKTNQESEEFFGGFALVIKSMRNCPKPIITRVQGKAIGGGVGIIAASDYVVGLHSASARLSELSLGFGPFIIGPVVERRIGKANFQSMTLDTEWRDGKWCLQTGLFSKVSESISELDIEIQKIARTLADSNPAAFWELKEIFWNDIPNLSELLDKRVKITGSLVLSDFVREKVKAVQLGAEAKRK